MEKSMYSIVLHPKISYEKSGPGLDCKPSTPNYVNFKVKESKT